MHPQIIKCCMAPLNGFFFEKIKSRPRITYREKYYLLAFTKIGDLKKNRIIFLQRKRQWNVTVYHDQWIKGVTAGGCGNAPYQGDSDKKLIDQ